MMANTTRSFSRRLFAVRFFKKSIKTVINDCVIQ